MLITSTSTIIIIILFILNIYLIVLQQKKNRRIIKLNANKQELEREKHLHTSIAKLTHELKNPLAVCNGYLDMLDLKDQAKSKKYMQIVKSEIKRSLTIINDFSTYGKLKEINKEGIDLVYLVEDISSILKSLLKKNNSTLEIKAPEELYLEADYNRLKQVFINILKNSIEAKKKNEDLHIKITIRKKNNLIKIKIKDNGIGMNKESLHRLYELFYTTKSTGTGIGVAYSKEVLKLHGGSISYKSALNEGTEVTITLPQEKSPKTFNCKMY